MTPLLPASVVEVMKPRFEQARTKLNSLSGQSVLPNWTEKVANVLPMLPQLPPKIDEQVLETVQLALLHGKQLHVLYHAANKPEPKRYDLHPLGLVQRGVATYVVGRVDAYATPHLFALQRIKQAELLDSSVVAPEGFTLQQFLTDGGMQFSGGKTVKLKALIHPQLIQSIEESPLGEDQQLSVHEHELEWLCLEVTVADSWQLRWWVLSLGEMIEVLEPAPLREELVERLRKALARYG